jgi:hypothetical protein
MLKLTDNGAHITLQGQSTPSGDGLFWFGSALLIGAIGVAMAMSLLPERWAIGALGLLIVGSFIFNRQRQQLKKQTASLIRGGTLDVQAGAFTHTVLGKQNRVVIAAGDQIEIRGEELVIVDANHQQKCQVSGFDSTKEAQVMQAVLQGQQFGKRNANIKMQSN